MTLKPEPLKTDLIGGKTLKTDEKVEFFGQVDELSAHIMEVTHYIDDVQTEMELRKKTDEWRKQTTKTEQEIERVRKEAESLKQQLAAAKAMAETASSDAEKERLTGEVEDLRRKLAMSDKDVTAAQLYFYQWQAAFNQLTQAISNIKDEDKAGKLCAALRAQLAAWGKSMEGAA